MGEPAAPSVPVESLGDDWEQVSNEVETLFELAAASVVGHTVVYEDTGLASTVTEESGVAELSRFVFATRLGFSPSLPPGSPRVVKPMVVSEATDEFATVLKERGFSDVNRQTRQRLSTGSGTRATLFGYEAQFPTEKATVPVAGWLAVWHAGDFLLAGGAYPQTFDGLAVDVDTSTYRDDLFAVLQRIE